MDDWLQKHPNWIDKLSHYTQIGGIETSVIDNGAGRGSRIAWVNAGAGLRYKVALDKAMDITDAFYGPFSIGWANPLGLTTPQRFTEHRADWLRTFGGGLLVTCGLSHVGGPEEDEFGERGLHGLVANTPAEIESVIQPDPRNGKMDFSLTGNIYETKPFGPSLKLRRTISGVLGQSLINISDEVLNLGNEPAPHMLLYHVNFGWPIADEGTELLWEGDWQTRNGNKNGIIFREGNDFKKCPPPLESHSSTGEEVAFIDISASKEGQCQCGIRNAKLGIEVSLKFPKKQLPWLTNWQHWGKGEYVTGLEPGTHPPIGQASARKNGTLIFIKPRETLHYSLQIEVQSL